MPKEVIRKTKGNIHSTETLTIMLTDMIINKKAYRILKQLGVIVCFHQKKVIQLMACQWQVLQQLTGRFQSFSNFDKLLEEI